MQKRQNQFSEFNPESFLAAEAKKKSKSTEQRQKAYRRLVVLDGDFKKDLVDQLDREHPGIVKLDETPEEKIESARLLRRFFERRLRQEGQRLGPTTNHLLYVDFIGTIIKRCLDEQKG